MNMQSVCLADELPGETVRRLDSGWRMFQTEAGAYAGPDELPEDAASFAAFVPGTVAQALEVDGRFDRENPHPLDDKDFWYRLQLDEAPGEAILRFAGLATIAEVYLNGGLILSSDSMFLSHDVPVVLWGHDKLSICFRALAPLLSKKGPRARWRPQMITPAGLRLFRTTALGRMPGWCPEVHAVGPWRPVSLIRRDSNAPTDVRISSSLDEKGRGRLRVAFKGGEGGLIRCAGSRVHLVKDGEHFVGEMTIPDVAPWWPATHGEPKLHDVVLEVAGKSYLIGQTGFRRIEIDHGVDGKSFGLKINGVDVFCRGVVWTNADIVRLPGEREDYRPWLEKAAAAGMNMIRIGGTMAYESPEFFKLCDELGLMVWQEFMLANFDYPVSDQNWTELMVREAEQLLKTTSASPSLTVLCGGSEVYQQAAMLGFPKAMYEGPLTQEILPGIVSALRPDCAWVANSPVGGAVPFAPNEGVTHYYGVGAYMRPLEDARRANVRFAAETLAFAHVPAQATLDKHLAVSPVHDPRWKARVPRDRGASWDFEDVRDLYLKLLFEVEPEKLRRENPGRYLDLSRVVTGEVIEATYAEWRRASSSCKGALLWTFQDLLPGAGWGLVDATGLPKPVYYGVKRAFRPLQIALTDEGTNGVDVHLVNDTAMARKVIAEISCLRDGAVPVVSGKKEIELYAHGAETIPATDFFGAFFDTAYAFRFGPPAHDVTVARLIDAETGEELASAFHFPLGRSAMRAGAQISSSLQEDGGNFWLELTTDRFAQNVEIDVAGFEADDNWFHLAPGKPKRVKLAGGEGAPSGEIRLAGHTSTARF